MSRRELTEAERGRSYAKYFYQPMAPAAEEVIELLDKGPIDPTLATPIERRNDLLKPGYLPTEIGYCVMPDGTGFVAVLTKMPGVTGEMLDWWFVWHGLESLRYKIWNPDEHFDVRVAEGLDRRLNTKLSLRERYWGTTDFVCQDHGFGPERLYISFMSPEDFGYDMDLFRPPNAVTAICANMGLREPKVPTGCNTHLAREIPGGIELRSRFWLGWNIHNKQPVRVAERVPLDRARKLAYHCAKEYANLAAILPKVYEENVNITDT